MRSAANKQLPSRLQRVAKATAFAIYLNHFDAWDGLTTVLFARLSAQERATLAWAALRSLEPEVAEKVSETVLGRSNKPLPPFLDPMADAAWWAAVATSNELAAYCLAAFKAMPKNRKIAFLEHVRGRKVA
ncbi:MAG: hypothetical protein NXI02_31100 [Rhodobacteraceae bacterium]|nr:hypothetical protein [Paracoccaceae bacterium]